MVWLNTVNIMREKIIEILRENWHHSYNDCADDLLGLGIVSKSIAQQSLLALCQFQ